VFQNGQGTVAVSALTPSVVRVRFSPSASPGRDHSYAILDPPARDPGAQVEIGSASSLLRTSALRVTMRHAPLRMSFASADGQSLDEDDPERGMAFVGRATRVWKRLRADEHVYGLGEKTGELDKRGRYRGGYAYAMWNSDTYAYGDDTDPVYVSVPFFIVLRGGRAHGIFLDNTFRTTFDIGKQDPDLLSFGAVDGALDYYFIDGPTPRDVVQRYTELTGRMPLPPMWSLGYNQCRYSYYPEAKVRNIADTFRLKRIPADVIWLDIHYLGGYNPFTWDRERFPDPGRMIRELRQDEFLFGRDILVAPVLREGVTGREVYLPKGTWYEYGSGRRFEGGKSILVPVTLDDIPVFVRGGSILFRQPVVQHTGEMAGQALRLLVFGDGPAEGSHYEDDGHTLAHQRGSALRRRFTARMDGGRWTLQAAAPEGSYRPATRDLEVEVRGLGDAASVTVGAEALPRVDAPAWSTTRLGWRRREDGGIVIRMRDRFEPFSIAISR
jgi:alpha-glucosidase (family GH31 glycosyl hydrolase)